MTILFRNGKIIDVLDKEQFQWQSLGLNPDCSGFIRDGKKLNGISDYK